MTRNTKQTSAEIASQAARVLQDPSASAIQRSLAASALSQSRSGNQTSAEMEHVASKALRGDHYSDLTKELAGSVLSQSNKDR